MSAAERSQPLDRSAAAADLRADGAAAVGHPPGWPLGGLRIIIGILWFQQLLWKIPPTFGCEPNRPAGLCDWIGREIAQPAIPLYADFLRAIVLPNLGVFGWFIWLGEAAVAASLLLGLLTRLGGALGFLMGLNLLIGLAGVEHEWYWTYLMLALLNLLFALTGAGRWWGLDGVLLPRLRAAAARGDRRAGWLTRLM
jgi:thiosulfate dehydrogenase (quinone) large subunit